MPELPEVETIRRGAEKYLKGLEISNIEIRNPKLFYGEPRLIIGREIVGLRRIAKVLIIDFAPALGNTRGKTPGVKSSQTPGVKERIESTGYSLLIHLKMTGQLVYQKGQQTRVGGHPEKSYEQPLPHKYSHIIYTLSNGGHLFFNDLRRFGWNKVVKTREVKATIGKSLAGVDILSPEFTEHFLVQLLTERAKRPIKEVLLDQSRLAGIGNIYASECLFYAGVRPTRKAGSLSAAEIEALYKGIKKAIDLGIKYGGSSPNSFINIEGKQGTFMRFAQVYFQKTCKAGHPVERVKQGGRTSWYCPVHQK